MEPSSTSTRVRRARHPNLQLSPTTTPFPTRDGTRQGRNPYQTWDWPIAAMACPAWASPRTPSFTRRARFQSSIDPGQSQSLSSPRPVSVLEKKVGVCFGEPSFSPYPLITSPSPGPFRAQSLFFHSLRYSLGLNNWTTSPSSTLASILASYTHSTAT